jgi:hypothetical protein
MRRTFPLLALSLSFLLFGNGMAGAAPHVCGIAGAPLHGSPSHSCHGKCCCREAQGSTDMKCRCGRDAKKAAPASASKTEGSALSIDQAFIHLSLPSLGRQESPESVFGREIIYLLNLNLLC